MFGTILISFININDTKHNNRKSGQKKYRAYRYSGNIGITNCTTVTVAKTLHEISQAV